MLSGAVKKKVLVFLVDELENTLKFGRCKKKQSESTYFHLWQSFTFVINMCSKRVAADTECAI